MTLDRGNVHHTSRARQPLLTSTNARHWASENLTTPIEPDALKPGLFNSQRVRSELHMHKQLKISQIAWTEKWGPSKIVFSDSSATVYNCYLYPITDTR